MGSEVIVYRRTVTEGDKSAVWCYIPYNDIINTVNGVEQDRRWYSNQNSFEVYYGNVERLQKITHRNSLSHYTNKEDETITLTVQEWQEQNETLRTHLGGDEDYPQWDSLDAEFAWRKFNDTWSAVYKKETTIISVPFRIVDLGAGPMPPYTKPNYLLMGDKITDAIGLYTYSPKIIELVESIGEKYGFIRVEYKVWNDDSTKGYKWSTDRNEVSYMKINGSYAPQRDTLKPLKGCIGTAEECMIAHNKNVAAIEAFWAEEKAKLSSQSIVGFTNMGELIKTIDGFASEVSRLDVKSKDSASRTSLYNRLSNLKAKLVKEANQQGNSQ
jgi:t-SNARE complex subunit (syntaxin)